MNIYADKLYQDEAIPLPLPGRRAPIPVEYHKMRHIANCSGFLSRDMLFYRQGKFMERFEDEFEYTGEFECYFPTYVQMTTDQLRGYFSWRTRVRRGEVLPTSLSFIFVYIYELLNQIGVTSLIDGFHKLKSFWQSYRELAPKIDRYCRLWLQDYVVYYNLERALLDDVPGLFQERELSILSHFSEHETDAVFDALNAFSPYKLAESRFFQHVPEAVKRITVGVFADLAEHYRKKSGHTIMEQLFGSMHTGHYQMFASAIFDEPPGRIDSVYALNDFHHFRCVNGQWQCRRFICYKSKLLLLGALLKNIDFMMRVRFDFRSPLKADENSPKFFLKLIARQLDQLAAEQKLQARTQVEIDLSKLQEIRATALATQSKLIVEPPEAEAAPEPPEIPVFAVPVETPDEAAPVSAVERRLLELLLTGGDAAAFARAENVMLSLLIDSINEKLFDRFGDTLVTGDGDTPELIEDYVDELKGILKI